MFSDEYSRCRPSRTWDRLWMTAYESSAPKRTKFVKKIQVLRKSCTACHIRNFTKISFSLRLLCLWLMKHMPSNFSSELWRHLVLEFFSTKLFLFSVECQGWSLCVAWVLPSLDFEYTCTYWKTQCWMYTLNFLLELSVNYYLQLRDYAGHVRHDFEMSDRDFKHCWTFCLAVVNEEEMFGRKNKAQVFSPIEMSKICLP